MKELWEKYVGKEGMIHLGGLEILVRCTSIKERWGKTRFLVEPMSGSGEIWVESLTLKQ